MNRCCGKFGQNSVRPNLVVVLVIDQQLCLVGNNIKINQAQNLRDAYILSE